MDRTVSSPKRKPLWITAGVLILGFVGLLYVIEGFDSLTSCNVGGFVEQCLDQYGIEPREEEGLRGIVFAPLLHGGWDHLVANTGPAVVLGFLSLLAGIARGLAATAIVWAIAGAGTWLVGQPHTVHLGASSLIFGWLTFLIVRGVFTRRMIDIVIGIVVFLVYGTLLWGVLPNDPYVSWEGHLFGAIGGVVAAWAVSARKPAVPPRPAPVQFP